MSGLNNISKGQVCPICGHKDWCGNREDYTYGHIWLCHRYDGRRDHVGLVEKQYGGKENGKKFANEYCIVDGVDGRYVLIPNNHSSVSSSNFQKYEEWYNFVQRSLQEFEEKNAAYCAEHGYTYQKRSLFTIDGVEEQTTNYVYVPMQRIKWKMDETVIEPLPNEILDKVLREWLECMVLCDWHRKKLMTEWDVSQKPEVAKVFAPEKIFDSWAIKTMPPDDKVRAEASAYYKIHTGGPTRKELVRRLILICKKHGLESPAGIPGLYFDKEEETWKILSRSGIIFPVYDVHGRIYRFRIGVDTPDVYGSLEGQSGTFHFYRDTWYFDRDDKGVNEKSKVAWRYGSSRNLIKLNHKGLPDGKPNGKYVNFSSYKEKRIEDTHTITNHFFLGCQCGGCVSVYRPKGGNAQIVWFTEGEKKAMVIAAVLNCTVVCLPGVSSYGKVFSTDGGGSIVEVLKQQGMRMAVVAYDADKESNDAVSRAEEKLLNELWRSGIQMLSTTEWHGEFGKGMDDMLLDGAMPDFRRVSF